MMEKNIQSQIHEEGGFLSESRTLPRYDLMWKRFEAFLKGMRGLVHEGDWDHP
jgi:hypothetical protein